MDIITNKENKLNQCPEVDPEFEKLCTELDNITFKRMVPVDEDENINDFYEAYF